MKYVKCLYDSSDSDPDVSKRLTINKIYKVIKYSLYLDNHRCDRVTIIDDMNCEIDFIMATKFRTWFVDVTTEVRNNKINSIIDEE